MRVPSDPDEILQLLSDLTLNLRNALEVGSVEVRDHFARKGRKLGHPVEIDKTVANSMMRYEALMRMHETWRLGSDYHIEKVALNGLSFRFDWCHVKAYKAFNGEPPAAHNTTANRDFYEFNQTAAQQAAQLNLKGIAWRRKAWRHVDWERIAPTLDRAHFLYCWQVDSQYGVVRTQLVAPREPGKFNQAIPTYWRKDVPHPVLGLSGIPTVNDVEEVDDLPLFLEKEAGEEGEND